MSDPAGAAPDDANDLRGFHFKRLLGKPLTWILIGIEVVVIGVVLAVYVGPAIGGAAAVAALLLGLLAVFAIADSRAEQGFFETYAAQNGLELGGRNPLPEATPLLCKGNNRYAERTLSGPFTDDVEGILALYTYEEESTDADGDRQTNYYHYTVGLVSVPECAAHVPRALLPAQVGPALTGEARGRLPLDRAGQAGERGTRRALRDLLRQGPGPGLATPALLPHLRRLARRGSAAEVRLRAGRRHALLFRQRPQRVGRRARHDPRRLSHRRAEVARGGTGNKRRSSS